MSLNGSTSSETIDAIRSDVTALRADLASLTKDIGDLRRVGTQEARDRIVRTAQELRNDAFDTIEDARKRFQEYPLACVAGAFGVGFVLGRLI